MKSMLRPLILGTVFVAACGVGPMKTPEEADTTPTWEVEHTHDDGVLLSVWGSGPDDVWVAGGQAEEGLLLHNEGRGWERVEVDAPDLVWWVYGFGRDHLYAVGNRGLILYYDGRDWTRIESGTTRDLFGVWGSSPDDVWIVGGDPNGPEGAAVVLRGARHAFTRVELPLELTPRALFKPYGHGMNDVLMVGTDGTVLRYDGEGWSQDETPTRESLFSMWGRSRSDLYAVGGHNGGELLHFDGQAWSRVGGEKTNGGLSGVFTDHEHPVIAVGEGSYVLEVDADGIHREPEVPTVHPWSTLHGVWGDGAGTTYAVGGELDSYPAPMRGVILHRR